MKLVQDIFFLSSPSSQLNTHERANEIYIISMNGIERNLFEFIKSIFHLVPSSLFELEPIGKINIKIRIICNIR